MALLQFLSSPLFSQSEWLWPQRPKERTSFLEGADLFDGDLLGYLSLLVFAIPALQCRTWMVSNIKYTVGGIVACAARLWLSWSQQLTVFPKKNMVDQVTGVLPEDDVVHTLLWKNPVASNFHYNTTPY